MAQIVRALSVKYTLFLVKYVYRKNHKISDTRKFAVITLKVEQDGYSFKE